MSFGTILIIVLIVFLLILAAIVTVYIVLDVLGVVLCFVRILMVAGRL